MQNEERLFFTAPDGGAAYGGGYGSGSASGSGSDGSGAVPLTYKPSDSGSGYGSSPAPNGSASASGSGSGCNLSVKVTVRTLLIEHLDGDAWRYHYNAYVVVSGGTGAFNYAWSVPGPMVSGAGTGHVQFYVEGPTGFDRMAGWGTAIVNVVDAHNCTATDSTDIANNDYGSGVGGNSGSGQLPGSNSGSASSSASGNGNPNFPNGSASGSASGSWSGRNSGSWSGSGSSSGSASGSGTTSPPLEPPLPPGDKPGPGVVKPCDCLDCGCKQQPQGVVLRSKSLYLPNLYGWSL